MGRIVSIYGEKEKRRNCKLHENCDKIRFGSIAKARQTAIVFLPAFSD